MDGREIHEDMQGSHGTTVEILDSSGESRGTCRAVKGRHDGRECFNFAVEDANALQSGGTIKVAASGEVYPIAEVRARVIGDQVAWHSAYLESKAERASGGVSFSNSNIGQVNMAGRDLFTVDVAAFGPQTDEIRAVLGEIRDAIERLDAQERDDASADLARLAQELQRPTPRAERILQYIGHISNVVALTPLASKLGSILASFIYGAR